MKIIMNDAIHTLTRIPLGGQSDDNFSEDWLQQQLFTHPDLLPVEDIDPVFGPLTPLCRELSTPAGYLDNLYINSLGLLTLAECKLWRNPQARREVVGQILDCAAQLSRWDYETLEKAIGVRLNQAGFSLYQFLRMQGVKAGPEAMFIDNVSRNLRRGRFLLLIVGDGIREQVEAIGEFLQNQAHLNFSFALVEINVYQLPEALGSAKLMAPRILARTVELERAVVRLEGGQLMGAPAMSKPVVTSGTAGRRTTITEQYFYEALAQLDPDLSAQVQAFLVKTGELGLVVDPTAAYLMIKTPDRQFNFGGFSPAGHMRNYGIAQKTEELGLGSVGEQYLDQLAALLPDASVNKGPGKFDWTVEKLDGSYVPIADCMAVQAEWLALIEQTLARINWPSERS